MKVVLYTEGATHVKKSRRIGAAKVGNHKWAMTNIQMTTVKRPIERNYDERRIS